MFKVNAFLGITIAFLSFLNLMMFNVEMMLMFLITSLVWVSFFEVLYLGFVWTMKEKLGVDGVKNLINMLRNDN